jgi:hypothetical protein
VTIDSGDRTASTTELVQRAAAQLSTLIRDELALAKAEMTEKGKRAGIGGGLLGGAGLLSLYGLGLLFALFVVLLDWVMPLWVALLIMAAAVFVVAGGLALLGRAQLKRAMPPVPSEAVNNASADVDALKTAISDGRQA